MVKLFYSYVHGLPDPALVPEALASLELHRRERLCRLKDPASRLLSFGAGLLLSHVLTLYGIPIDSVKISETNKPFCDGLFFNISHSLDAVILAVGDCQVGCDIEAVRPRPLGVAERFFTKNECAFLNSLPESERDRAFFRFWSAKESYMKYLGVGLALSPSSFEIDLKNEITATRGDAVLPCRFREYPFDAYAVCVCSDDESFASTPTFVDLSDLLKRT